MKKYFIITGASKGIGRAFAEKLLHPDHVLFLISRSEPEGISRQAMLRNCRVHHVSFDLSFIEKIPALLSNLFDHINDDCRSLHLINNAGVTEPVMPIDQAETGAIEKNIQVNYLAPVLLTSNFIRLSENMKFKKQILNITSGASFIPHHGMSMYCSTKAAIDQFTRCVGLEQKVREFPVDVHAISPGFVDTQMPNELLEKTEEDFGSVKNFNEAKKQGKFAGADEVAGKILDLWLNDKLKPGEVSHLGDY